jgi:hypothetical protein
VPGTISTALDARGYLWQGTFMMMIDFAAGKTGGQGNGFPYYYYYSREKSRSRASSA